MSMSRAFSSSLAGSQVTTIGRLCVTAEGDRKDFQNDEKDEIERDLLSLSVTPYSSNLPTAGSVESSTTY